MCTVAPVVVAKYKMANMVAKNFFTAYLQRYILKNGNCLHNFGKVL